jgi:hypothetical protein
MLIGTAQENKIIIPDVTEGEELINDLDTDYSTPQEVDVSQLDENVKKLNNRIEKVLFLLVSINSSTGKYQTNQSSKKRKEMSRFRH